MSSLLQRLRRTMEHEAIQTSGHLIIQIVGGTFGLLLIAAAVQAFSKRIKIPFTVALVVVGILLAQFGHLAGAVLGPILSMELPPEAVFFVFLPALVFESAFNLERPCQLKLAFQPCGSKNSSG